MPGPFNQWLNFFTPRARIKAANKLYLALVAQSRQPGFYLSCEVPDTVDGRFDMIAIHCFLLMNRLKDQGEDASKLSQVLFDEMFADMDRGLRELGVGDMGVGKRVRAMAKAYLGRVRAYDHAMEQVSDVTDGTSATLEEALVRNLYRGEDVSGGAVKAMASYVLSQHNCLLEQPVETLLAGEVHFGPSPADQFSMEANG
jgi:cytochrome b pre-mRNA-processing protein 3